MNILKGAVAITLSLTLCVGLFLAASSVSDSCQSIREYENQKKAVVAGEIIDKQVENGYSSLFRGYTPQRYYLFVQFEYDNNEEFVASEKSFEVERDVYLAYSIGDYFDSQNFNTADYEQQNENAMTLAQEVDNG